MLILWSYWVKENILSKFHLFLFRVAARELSMAYTARIVVYLLDSGDLEHYHPSRKSPTPFPSHFSP